MISTQCPDKISGLRRVQETLTKILAALSWAKLAKAAFPALACGFRFYWTAANAL